MYICQILACDIHIIQAVVNLDLLYTASANTEPIYMYVVLQIENHYATFSSCSTCSSSSTLELLI